MDTSSFNAVFQKLTGNKPFPWQEQLLRRFTESQLGQHTALDIPTGLGKTAVMAIWLVAGASGASVPRKLFYIVDRRAVVDQATKDAENLRDSLEKNSEIKQALGLLKPLLISTLRGQHVDNREWMEDPAMPAIVVGTIDMIGSRLLFGGYGVSRKMRPFHAGLIGADTLIVLDEAHLVPPFEKLLETIVSSTNGFRPTGEDRDKLIPGVKLLTLSATARSSRSAFGLGKADYEPGTITYQRLTAVKRLSFKSLDTDKKLSQKLAEEAWALSDNGKQNSKIIVFCQKPEGAAAAKNAVETLAKGNKKEGIPEIKISTELFVGGRRVYERQNVVKWLEENCFLAGTKSCSAVSTFLFATSAGEVGVDLDAYHMVCDVVAWERMVQRLGRVNRRGEGRARIVVIREPEPKPSKAAEKALAKPPEDRDKKEQKSVTDHEAKVEEAKALVKPFELLLQLEDGIDVSPIALQKLKEDSAADEPKREILAKATSPVPSRPALTRPLVDAWSMTSLKEHAGRPRVQPWLRGWIDEEPQTTVVWRKHMPFLENIDVVEGNQARKDIEDFFEAAAPHTSEVLETETERVLAWLKKRAALAASKAEKKHFREQNFDALRPEEPFAVILEADGTLRRVLKLAEVLVTDTHKKASQRLERQLQDSTLVVDRRFAGLNENGLLDSSVLMPPRTVDDGDLWDAPVRFRVFTINDGEDSLPTPILNGKTEWKTRLKLPIKFPLDREEPSKWLIVKKWRWDITTADDGAISKSQGLADHQKFATAKAADIAQRLGLPDEYATMLKIAARLHDEGKRHDKWQNAFNAKMEGRPYAKTPGPINHALLDGYRHEFESVAIAKNDPEFKALREELKELALHIIAAHHGFARPNISTSGCPDAPPSLLEERAREIAMRFARLQRQWGPWGLAWWESLLRAADQQASRELEQQSE